LQDALRHAVDALPSRQREAFRLTNRQDLSYKEAAQVMGIAKNTVAVHVHEALRSLRDAIDELHSDSSRKPS
jgi:RNA polymerase sigma factor (sigma-70 family)